MAGYSGTPLPKKLGIKTGHRVALLGAPRGYPKALGELPAKVRVDRRLHGGTDYDVLLVFSHDEREMARGLAAALAHLAPAGGLWAVWPKKTSGVPTDLSFDVVQRLGLDLGVVDSKICAVDETYSGLRFVVRTQDRPGWERIRSPVEAR